MGRNIGPKTKKARRIGEALRDRDAKFLVKRNYPPGMHGQGRRRISEFGQQLLEKQKAKWIYGLRERQFRKYYKEASRKKGVTPQLLLEYLELRLDNVVYRMGFAESRSQGRQMVSHGLIMVNGKKVNVPSYRVAIGDVVSVAEGKKTKAFAQKLIPKLKEFKTQEWIELDGKNLSGKVLQHPTHDNTGNTIQMQLISEHYSR